jgi:hypothetical protein
MIRKCLFLITVWIFCILEVDAQIDKYNQINLHPVSPTAFQFLKYTEMPVSEYTGLANIAVPMYTIKVDEVEIPIQLTYHSQGIRVNQEASWVGLGWDLRLGSIVQQINDRDDYVDDFTWPNVKRLPDYFSVAGDGTPWLLPMRRKEPSNTPGTGWSNPYPINAVEAKTGFAISTGYYVPVQGQFDMPEMDLFNARWYDSEPDLFTASFLGETVKFIVDFAHPTHIVVLNQQGYKVQKTVEGFRITNPHGTAYYFEVKSVVQNSTSSTSIEGTFASSIEIVSNIFFLNKIVTTKGKAININYSSTNSALGFPSASSKLQILDAPSDIVAVVPGGYGTYQHADYDSRPGVGQPSGDYESYSNNSEKNFYLSSINFPEGSVSFNISDRIDLSEGKKLDKVELKNISNEIVNSWTLNYSYFDASSINSNGYLSSSLNGDVKASKRLKLLNVTQVDGSQYQMEYSSMSLPKKNSYATDYWGYYNGQLTNTSFSPNPASIGYASLGNNGNNKDANLTYAKAAILESIRYPTGGKVVFDYGLNEFTNLTQMIGMPWSLPSLKGFGLRIENVTHYSDDLSIALKTRYTYEGGKLISPQQIYRQVPYARLTGWTISQIQLRTYLVCEFSCNGVFTSNPLGSINGVGYDKVTKEELNLSGVSKGKTVSEFYNTPDKMIPSIDSRIYNSSVPSYKSIDDPENGCLKSVTVYNPQNSKLRATVNTYFNTSSDIYYGARISNNGNLYYGATDGAQFSIPQHAIAYIPIYDVITKLHTSATTTYDENENSLVSTTLYAYDTYGQVVVKNVRTNEPLYAEIAEYYDHDWDYYQRTGSGILGSANMHSEVTAKKIRRRRSNVYTDWIDVYKYEKNYTSVSGKVVESSATIYDHPGDAQLPKTITFDQHDDNANPTQVTSDGLTTSMLWDYNKSYLVAEVKGAIVGNIAYSSFEADGKGNWQYSGLPVYDNSAPTGRKVYDLTNGYIGVNGIQVPNTYIVSYWSKNGAQAVSNSISTKTGSTYNAWTYYEHVVQLSSAPYNNTITISGGGTIDELRLYPKGSFMSTYTYDPLIGVTSQCDVNNNVIYYQYDGSNRLYLIRDQKKNILKKHCYNYFGQTENCSTGCTSTAPNWQTINQQCQLDASGGNTGYQIVTEKDFNICSLSYGHIRQTLVSNLGLCPLPLTCDCSSYGEGWTCINEQCEQGVKVYTSSFNEAGTWICTYHYEFSDGSWSTDYSEMSGSPCL